MTDLECSQPDGGSTLDSSVTNKETPGRRELKGLRRLTLLGSKTLTVGEHPENDGSRTSFTSLRTHTDRINTVCGTQIKDEVCTSTQEGGSAGNTRKHKGISIKNLKSNLKAHESSSKEKMRNNYKSTRKKLKVDNSQRLIRDFFTKTTSNQVLVGSSAQPDESMLSDSSE